MDYWHRIRQLVGTEPLIIPSAAGAVVQDGKVLLVRHSLLKKWQLPGGVQEIGEAIQQTAEREIREELGLDLRASRLIGIYSGPQWIVEYPDGSRTQQLTFFFLMESKLTPIRFQDDEIAAYRFFAPDEIPAGTMECCQQKVLDVMSFDGQVVFR